MCVHALWTSQGLLIYNLISADIMILFPSTNHGKKNIRLEREISVFVRIEGLNCRQHVKDNVVFPKCTLICVPSGTVCIRALHHWRLWWLVGSCRLRRFTATFCSEFAAVLLKATSHTTRTDRHIKKAFWPVREELCWNCAETVLCWNSQSHSTSPVNCNITAASPAVSASRVQAEFLPAWEQQVTQLSL